MRILWAGLYAGARVFFWVIFGLWGLLLIVVGAVATLCCSCKKPPHDTLKKVVIVGGGFAGAYAAKKLEPYFRVALIDQKDYFEFTPSVPRTIVEPNHVDKIQIRHRTYLDLTRTVVYNDEVTNASRNSVEMASGKEADFDYLVITSGSTYNEPFKEENVVVATRGNTLSQYYQTAATSESILVIGGGIVGVEVAAELAETFPGKSITLVHSGPTLMNRSTATTAPHDYAIGVLERWGVNVVLGDRVMTQAGEERRRFVTRSGQVHHADLAFMCTGIVPNSGFLRNDVFAAALDDKGFVRVNRHLQMEGFGNVFVGGDVAAINEEKLAQSAEHAAHKIVQNIYRLEAGSQLTDYHGGDRPILVSLGRYDGILLYKTWTVTGFLPAVMKEFVEWKCMVTYRFRSHVVWAR